MVDSYENLSDDLALWPSHDAQPFGQKNHNKYAFSSKNIEKQDRSRRWKDHFKSDFRSDQDHLLEK
jgi:hypothetical protein